MTRNFKPDEVIGMIQKKVQLKKDLKNVMNLDPDSGELTLLTGGPPCQGYSGIGHRRSHYVDKDKIPFKSSFLIS